MTTSTRNNKNLLDLSANLRGFVEKHKWVTRYDTESDSFSVTKPRLSRDARIKYFDDEIGLYITKNNDVEGIFVEYFSSNFIKHHKDLKTVLDSVRGKKNEGLVELSREKVKKIAPDLERAIRDTLAENLTLHLKFN